MQAIRPRGDDQHFRSRELQLDGKHIGPEMSIELGTKPRRIWWRFALLVLVVLPFLPDLAIYAVGGLAKVNGCVADQKEICRIAGINVSKALSGLVTTSIVIGSAFVLGLTVVWLVVCYLVIARGWAGFVARCVLALSVTVIFARLPYLAPYSVIAPLADPSCKPSGGGGPCPIFGGDVSSAHHTDALQLLVWPGDVIALSTAAAYAIVAAIIKAWRARARGQPAQSP